MNVSIILAHPINESFNHAIAKTASEQVMENGHNTLFHDLYAENFDPVLPGNEIQENIDLPEEIKTHCDEMASADGIIIIHPNWWGQPPAILTGWIDRVIRPGVAYRFLEGDNGEGTPIGLLKAKSAIVFNTSNTHPEREENVFGDPLELIWRKCIFQLCGINTFYREMFRILITSNAEQREKWLGRVKETVNKFYPPE